MNSESAPARQSKAATGLLPVNLHFIPRKRLDSVSHLILTVIPFSGFYHDFNHASLLWAVANRHCSSIFLYFLKTFPESFKPVTFKSKE